MDFMQVEAPWELRDAESYERDARTLAHEGYAELAANLYENAVRLRLRILGPSDTTVINGIEILAHTSNQATRIEVCLGGDLVVSKRRLMRLCAILAEVRGCANQQCLAASFNMTLNT